MCGRFTQSLSFNSLLKLYKLKNKVELRPNYNVTPQSDIPKEEIVLWLNPEANTEE